MWGGGEGSTVVTGLDLLEVYETCGQRIQRTYQAQDGNSMMSYSFLSCVLRTQAKAQVLTWSTVYMLWYKSLALIAENVKRTM